jgi:hypothetical protein
MKTRSPAPAALQAALLELAAQLEAGETSSQAAAAAIRELFAAGPGVVKPGPGRRLGSKSTLQTPAYKRAAEVCEWRLAGLGSTAAVRKVAIKYHLAECTVERLAREAEDRLRLARIDMGREFCERYPEQAASMTEAWSRALSRLADAMENAGNASGAAVVRDFAPKATDDNEWMLCLLGKLYQTACHNALLNTAGV